MNDAPAQASQLPAEHSPTIEVGGRNPTVHRISCPYCLVGFAIVRLVGKRGEIQSEPGPHKCGTCRRYFQLGVKVTFYGKPMPGEGKRG